MPDPQTVTRRGKIFEFGDFPDKSFALTPEEWAAANADLGPVPLDLEHHKTILDGHLGHARDFEVRDNSLFGAVEIPEWLAKITEGVPIKVSASFDRLAKRLQKLSLVLAPRIPDAAVFHAAFAAGAIPEVPAEFAGNKPAGNPITMSEPIKTRTVQSTLQSVHDMVSSIHPGVCPGVLGKGGYTGADPLKGEDTPLPAAKFGDQTREYKALRTAHDAVVDGGASCGSANMSATPPGKKPMKINLLEALKFWKKEGEPGDFELDLAEFSAPEPEPKPPAAPVAPAWTDSPEYKAMAAEVKAMKDKADADRVALIEKDAVAFAADLVRAGKLRPPDAPNVAATYRTAALDDVAHPTEVTFSADGQEKKGGRLDQLKATWASMPAVMNLGRELVNPSADLAGFTVLSPDRQPADPNKPPDKARVDYLLSLSPAGNGVLAARKPA